ncbi:MAG: ABC transporter ATP-binding protein [SAR324 cluster bacterium]|nr:ABC transporter ATP-binding protein [SAR324 cluster bacterium]
MKSITKTFGEVVANDAVDLKIKQGEIHAIVGENGAGKTTIMEILYGFYQADSGDIKIFGKPVRIENSHKAIALGIGMVHQHFMLIPPLTVTENIILGMEPIQPGGILKMQEAVEKIRQISEEYGLQIDPLARVESLSVGLQQRVEILKALYRGAEILILDEPTAVLTPLEVNSFFEILHRLEAQGKTIIIITHKLKEVLEVSNEVTVMRNGKKVGHLETRDATSESLATMMVGRDVLLRVSKKPAEPGKVLLKLENIIVDVDNQPKLKGVSLEVRSGEVFGIAGVEGNGQTEIIEILTGLRPVGSGEVWFRDQNITNASARKVKEHRIGHVPADRKAHGYVAPYSNAENLILGFHYREPFCRKNGFFNFSEIEKNATQRIKENNVQPPFNDLPTSKLSGGNQQKLVVAREFSQNPDLLIVAQLTRGVDIGAIEFIHQRIIDLRDEGKAILLVSAELEEIRSLSDRAVVFYEGEITGEIDLENYDEREIGLMMTGELKKPMLANP